MIGNQLQAFYKMIYNDLQDDLQQFAINYNKLQSIYNDLQSITTIYKMIYNPFITIGNQLQPFTR
jgi:hypothetical protein